MLMEWGAQPSTQTRTITNAQKLTTTDYLLDAIDPLDIYYIFLFYENQTSIYKKLQNIKFDYVTDQFAFSNRSRNQREEV